MQAETGFATGTDVGFEGLEVSSLDAPTHRLVRKSTELDQALRAYIDEAAKQDAQRSARAAETQPPPLVRERTYVNVAKTSRFVVRTDDHVGVRKR